MEIIHETKDATPLVNGSAVPRTINIRNELSVTWRAWEFDTSNGTIIRLPLKDECMARDFELSDQTVTHETTDRLFARLRRDMFNCLLFLNSFQSIQLNEIDE
jgi:hypothetical protein